MKEQHFDTSVHLTAAQIAAIDELVETGLYGMYRHEVLLYFVMKGLQEFHMRTQVKL